MVTDWVSPPFMNPTDNCINPKKAHARPNLGCHGGPSPARLSPAIPVSGRHRIGRHGA
jgi:hypothetical protein